jgi:hypothetical protein
MSHSNPIAGAGNAAVEAPRPRTSRRSRGRVAAVALLVALPLGVVGTQAGALSAWKTFGSGTAAGLGPIGSGVVDSSSVYLDSISREDPARIRLVVKGPNAGRAHVTWHMICGNTPTEFAETRRNSFNAPLPHTLDLSDKLGGVARWRFCAVDTQVTYGRFGVIKLLLQARY